MNRYDYGYRQVKLFALHGTHHYYIGLLTIQLVMQIPIGTYSKFYTILMNGNNCFKIIMLNFLWETFGHHRIQIA